MKTRSRFALSLIVMLVAAGCASTKVQNTRLVNEKLPRPANFWVYDFVATAADMPADSAMAGQYSEHATPQTAEQIAEGRRIGGQLGAELAAKIRELGLPAVRARESSQPQVNDIVLRGYLVSVDEGSAVKRVAIGFGAGGSELRTVAEGFQMTPTGLRKLGSGTLDSGGGKTPGAAVGAAAFIATANPVGLIVSSGVKAYGEVSGKSTIEGRITETAKEIAEVIRQRAVEQGWIK